SLIFDRYDYNALAFMTLQVPLTGWWETTHKIRQQNYLIQKAENERADYVEKMELETRQAWCNIEEAQSQVTLAESSVRSAKANLHDTKANFDAGMVPVSELLEAQTLLLQAQNQLTDALIDLKIKAEKYQMLTK
ncbi:MAG: TolC family protein, partial [Bacteroidales bacterium]|nr:TolC family protein [Bacteroidales bacterium]